MDINGILEYQKVDYKYFEIENKLKSSDEAKKVLSLQKYMHAAQSELLSLNKDADELIATYERAGKALEDAKKEYAEFSENPEDDVKAMDFYIKALDKLGKNLESLTKETRAIVGRVGDIKNKSDAGGKALHAANAEHGKAMESFGRVKAELSKEAATVKAELKALEGKIDPALLVRYKTLRDEKKRLPIVAALRDSVCSACGMDLSADILSRFSDARPIQECPNCGVLIYQN